MIGIHARNPLEHCFRDVLVVRHHAFGAETRYETVGQVYLGLPPDFPTLAFKATAMIEFLMVPEAPKPVAPYSHATVADGWVFVTGQVQPVRTTTARPCRTGSRAKRIG